MRGSDRRDGPRIACLYAIVDTDALAGRGLDVVAFAEAVLAARPAAIQLRDKHGAPRDTLALLDRLAPLARAANVPLFANDRADLALLSGCHGVHVGQEDLPVAAVRALAAGRPLAIGVSTHDEAQLEAALASEPDYVAFGPVFATSSKEQPDPVVGIDGLARAATRAAAREVPLVAIGGIGERHAAEVLAVADAIAVIGALLPEGRNLDDVRRRAERLAALGRRER